MPDECKQKVQRGEGLSQCYSNTGSTNTFVHNWFIIMARKIQKMRINIHNMLLKIDSTLSMETNNSTLMVCIFYVFIVLVTQSSFQLHGSLEPAKIPCPWNSPGKNTGVTGHSLLQRIFPTQGLNPGLPNCGRILYQLIYQGSSAAAAAAK